MIHVCTIHYRTDKWIELQAHHLSRALPEFQVYANLEAVPDADRWAKQFDHVSASTDQHADKLNELAAVAVERAASGDWLLFLDGDAFPVADPTPVAKAAFDAGHALVGVQRLEALGGQQPHPCFTIIPVDEWVALPGDWRRGYQWRDANGQRISDVGGNLLGLLTNQGRSWLPLHRLNTVNPHPTMFAVYGTPGQPLVYHHGAGFRAPLFRIDRHTGHTTSQNRALSREVLGRLIKDPDSWKEFVADA